MRRIKPGEIWMGLVAKTAKFELKLNQTLYPPILQVNPYQMIDLGKGFGRHELELQAGSLMTAIARHNKWQPISWAELAQAMWEDKQIHEGRDTDLIHLYYFIDWGQILRVDHPDDVYFIPTVSFADKVVNQCSINIHAIGKERLGYVPEVLVTNGRDSLRSWPAKSIEDRTFDLECALEDADLLMMRKLYEAKHAITAHG